MALLPGIHRRELEHRRYLVNHHPLVHGSDVILDKGATSPRAPVFRLLEGTVIVRLQAGFQFVDAQDPRGARCAPAEVRAAQPADAAWANTTITASLSSTLGFAVLLDAAAVSTLAVVDQLNRHPLFAAHFLADDTGGLVRVRTREAGAHKALHVESTLPAAFGPLGTFGHGVDADYRVTDRTVDVRDLDGSPIEVLVPTLLVGHFDESELLQLTPEARGVLSRRGSFFNQRRPAMPVTALDDLLSVDTLTGVVKTFADQADNRSCTALFAQHARPLLPAGESVAWDEVEYSRHLAPVSGPESPHTRAKRLGVRKRGSAMAMIKVYKDLPASHLFLSRAPGTNLQDAEAILTAELEDMVNLIANTKEYLACGALLGVIEVDPAKVPGSDVAFKVEFGVPALAAAAGASWADPATKIRSVELGKLKGLYKDQSGLRAEVVVTEPTVEGYLTNNADIRELARDALGLTILNNMNRQGVNPQWALLGGLNFRFTDGTFKPEGGPITRYFPADHCVVLPAEARLPQILGWAEGKVHVPAGSIFAGPQGATGLVRELRGSYAYAELRTDPMGVRVYAGWYGLPLVLNPSAILKFKVTP